MKGQVSYCHHLSSVNISHFNLLLRNHWANCNQTLVEWSLDGPLPKLCPVFSNGGHLGWRAGLSDPILKGTHPVTIPARFGLIWFSGFREEDLNVIFYQNMPNLHNRWGDEILIVHYCFSIRQNELKY
jgi:hypothetical protein